MNKAEFGYAARLAAAAIITLVFMLPTGGCGGSGGGSSAGGLSASSNSAPVGKGQVAFTIHWPALTPTTSRLVPVASQALKFTVTENEAPNNVVVLTKTTPRPADGQPTTVLLNGLPTVNVTIQVDAYPNADATGVIQATGSVKMQVQQNQTINQSVTLGTTITKVAVTSTAPILIDANGKITLNLSDKTDIQATLTAAAYDKANNLVLTALNKWGYKTDKPGVASVSPPTAGPTKGAHAATRDQGVNSAVTTLKAVGDGTTVLTVTETESQVSAMVTVSVVGSANLGWNQPMADAQNSNCSSGPAAAGGTAGQFGPVPDGDPSDAANQFDTSFGTIRDMVESPDGNLAFDAYAQYISDGGVLVYTKSGSKISKFGPSDANPIYGADGTLYTVNGSNGTSAISAHGPSNWGFSTSKGNGGFPLTLSGDGGTIYAANSENLYALDAHSGAQRWLVNLGFGSQGYGGTKPAVSLDNTTVYQPTKNGLSAFDAATGNKLWDSANASCSTSTYVGVGPTGTVFCQSSSSADAYNDSISALDPATGKTIWSKVGVTSPFVLSRNGHVNCTMGGPGAGVVLALNGNDGSTAWTSGSGGYYIGGGAADGTVYVNKAESRDYYNVTRLGALSGTDGSELWLLTPNLIHGIFGGTTIPTTAGRFGFEFVSGDGTVYAFETPAATGSPAQVVAIR